MTKPELRQELNVRQQLDMQLTQLQEDVPEARNLVVDLTMNCVAGYVRSYMESSPLDIARSLRQSPAHQMEFEILLTRRLLEEQGGALEEIIHRDRGTPREQRAEIRGLINGKLPNAFSRTVSGKGVHSSEAGRILERMYAERKNIDAHYEELVSSGAAQLHELSVADIPHVGQLYEQYRLTFEEALQLAVGNNLTTKRTFIFPFNTPDHEQDEMQEKLFRTEWMSKRKTLRGRREKETMYGMNLYGPMGELLGTSVHLVSPVQPGKDRAYMDEQEKFLEHGISGGTMVYPSQHEKDAMRTALLSGRSAKLFLIIGKIAGAAKLVMDGDIQNLWRKRLVHDDYSMLTYTLNGLRMDVNGISLADKPFSIGQNIGSLVSLTKRGWTFGRATDENPDGPCVSFPVEMGDLNVRTGWIHAGAPAKVIRQSAQPRKLVINPARAV